MNTPQKYVVCFVGLLSLLAIILSIVAISKFQRAPEEAQRITVNLPDNVLASAPPTTSRSPSSSSPASGLVGGYASLGGFKEQDISATAQRVRVSRSTFLLALGGLYPPWDVIDSNGQVAGFNVELINLVCGAANMDCRTVLDPYSHCWDTSGDGLPVGGIGLMDNYYDACVGWLHTPIRANVFSFSAPYTPKQNAQLLAKIGSTVPAGGDFGGAKIGFQAGFFTDSLCAKSNGLSNFVKVDINTNQELLDKIRNDEIVAGFVGTDGFAGMDLTGLVFIGDVYPDCALGGLSLMTAKDSLLEPLWNEGLALVRQNGQLADLCSRYPGTVCLL